ncbi:hypothetical protein M2149_000804 [Lachnospiraceae bacterium PFB1-21]
MERFTERIAEDCAEYENTGLTPEDVVRINDFANSQLAKTIAKLQAYERTGLTPEEIMDGKMLTGWIPVAEQLPKLDEDGYAYVLVCMDDEFVATTDYTRNEGFSLWEDSGEVIAWMPLPEPYKGD